MLNGITVSLCEDEYEEASHIFYGTLLKPKPVDREAFFDRKQVLPALQEFLDTYDKEYVFVIVSSRFEMKPISFVVEVTTAEDMLTSIENKINDSF
jgi:hypothetical protein